MACVSHCGDRNTLGDRVDRMVRESLEVTCIGGRRTTACWVEKVDVLHLVGLVGVGSLLSYR